VFIRKACRRRHLQLGDSWRTI